MAALVARGMGAEGLGVFTVSLGAVLVVTPLLAAGQVEVLIREVARSPGQAAGLVAGSLAIQRRILGWAAVPTALALVFVADPALRETLLAFVPYVWMRVEILTRGAAFKGLDRMDVEVRARLYEIGVAAVLIAGAAAFEAPVWLSGVALSAGGAAGLASLHRQMHALSAEPVPDLTAQRLLRLGLPFVGLGAGFQLLLRSDTFVLEGLGVPNATIGHYGAAAALTWGGLAAAQLVAVAFFPTVSRRAEAGAGPAGTAWGAAALGVAIGLAVAGAMIVLRQPLLAVVFGAGIAGPAEPLLLRLVWVLPAASATMMLGVVLAAWHRQNRQLAALLAMLLVALALEVSLIQSDGPAGAARAVVVVHGLTAAINLALAAWPGGLASGHGPLR